MKITKETLKQLIKEEVIQEIVPTMLPGGQEMNAPLPLGRRSMAQKDMDPALRAHRQQRSRKAFALGERDAAESGRQKRTPEHFEPQYRWVGLEFMDDYTRGFEQMQMELGPVNEHKLTRAKLKILIKEELEGFDNAWDRAMARIRRLSDRAKTGGTALATKAGREIKMHINQLKKDGAIDEPTWRKARRALYKDKTGDMAIQILVDAIGPGEVEGAFGGGVGAGEEDDITGPATRAVGRLKEFKLTKNSLSQLIREELNKD
jgi:hypothetical protein